MDSKKQTFLIIGNDSLTIACIHYLLIKEDAKLIGIVSPIREIKELAMKSGVPLFDLHQLCQHFKPGDFDYLLSIANPSIVSNDILQLPKKYPINCHYALLPQYAGSFPTAWALLEQQDQIGVTWHIMKTEVDSGDILKQVSLKVDPEDTTQSLNVKCFDIALDTFKELIEDIFLNLITLSPQKLKDKTHFDFSKKPRGAGLLNFSETAKEISAVYRGLSFGEEPNKLATPKIILRERGFIVNKLSIASGKTPKPPGTIVGISETEIRVCSKTEDVLLQELKTFEGKILSIPDLMDELGLMVGDRITEFDSPTLVRIQKHFEAIAKYESFWLKKLRTNPSTFNNSFMSFEWTTCTKGKRTGNSSPYQEIKFDYIRDTDEFGDMNVTLLTVLLLYFYRINNFENYTIPIDYVDNNKGNCLALLYENFLPFATNFNKSDTFIDLTHKVEKIVDEFRQKKNFSKDIFARYPNLIINKDEHYIVIKNVNCFENIEINTNNQLLFLLNEKKSTMRLYFNTPKIPLFLKEIKTHLNSLFKSLKQSNQMTTGEYSFLDEKQKNRLLYDWVSPEKKEICPYETLNEMFFSQCVLNPNAIAVKFNTTCLTYTELDKQSNQLAQYLSKAGLKRGVLVAIALDRGLDLIIAILAVIKSGATYLPIDMRAPSELRQHIIRNATPKILLTNVKEVFFLNDSIPCELKRVNLDKEKKSILKEPLTPLAASIEADDLAYLIYTSGSTGLPKGVPITHKSLLEVMYACGRYFNIKPGMNVLQYSALGFDGAIWDIFSALLNGATLCLADQGDLLPTEPLLKTLKTHKINMVALPASVLNLFYPQEALPDLKILLSVGDVCSKETIHFWSNKLAFYNGYGPTEATISTTLYRFNASASQYCIGKPWVSKTETYVLDHCLNPVPEGVPGILYITGNLSTGYYKDEDLTKQKFIEVSIEHGRTKKMFCTNDIVCWTKDGNLRYLGRADRQAKLRGFRINLTLIEDQIKNHELVSECFVHIKMDETGNKILIAHVCLIEKTEKVIEHIKEDLKLKLPDYMIPQIFVELPEIPLTCNGKIDSKLLSESPIYLQPLDRLYIPPSTPTEVKLEKIWCTILNLRQVSVYDNFFDMGGHSLLVAQLLASIYRDFNCTISFEAFMKDPTIRHTAKILLNEPEQPTVSEENIVLKDITAGKETIDSLVLPKKRQGRFHDILVTGATGFLGQQLLYDLCLQSPPNARIYCLIRASSSDHLKSRFKNMLLDYPLKNLNNAAKAKIVPILADINKLSLGLDNETYHKLSSEVDVIYHAAAHVNHLYNYAHLRQANVQATLELIKFSAHNRLKKLNYISTLSASSEYNKAGRLIEDFLTSDKRDLMNVNGYSQTKWVSEVLLKKASEVGIPIDIFRPGWILWNKNTPVALVEKNTLFTLFQTCISLGYAPNWKLDLNLIGVKSISQFIVTTGQENLSHNRVFNMINKENIAWQTIIELMKTKQYIKGSMDSKIWHKKCSSIGQTLSVLMSSKKTIQSGTWLQLNNMLKNMEHRKFNEQLKKLNVNESENTEAVVSDALLSLVVLNNIEKNLGRLANAYG